MKKNIYISVLLFMTISLCGCNNEQDITDTSSDESIIIEGVAAELIGMEETGNSISRATESGFSVNITSLDPTKVNLITRGNGWVMDLNMYNSNISSDSEYANGSFKKANYIYEDNKAYWKPVSNVYYPNYFSPKIEAWIYPESLSDHTYANVGTDQSTKEKILAIDILHRKKDVMGIAHKPYITVLHQHAMLDFVISDIKITEIKEVTVSFGDKIYTPYKVENGKGMTANSLEYMVILPENSGSIVKPIVNIKTDISNGVLQNTINYQQTININEVLAENTCYCFTLKGAELKVSPVTVLNWATGVSIPGEYIAVTAYPTFKAISHQSKTFYFYYDSKYGEQDGDKFIPYLQKIDFNQNGECTIKPDGRIVTHILPDTAVEYIEVTDKYTVKSGYNIDDYSLNGSQVILDKMFIDINDLVTASETE